MENLTEDFEKIKQDLEELSRRFSKADIVLSDLEEIQAQFENLAQTYKQLKEYVLEVSLFNKESNEIIKLIQQAQTNFEHSFEKLREANEVKTDQIYDEFSKLEDKLKTYHSRIDNLEQKLFDEFQKDSRSHQKQMRIMRNAIIVLFILLLCLGALILIK